MAWSASQSSKHYITFFFFFFFQGTVTLSRKIVQKVLKRVGYTIDIIDYVTGIGNSSREQYIRAGDNPCRIDLPKNHKNAPKINKKWPKIEHFSNTFDNIYLTKTLRSLKIGYPSGPALLLTVDSDNKLLQSVFEAF